MKHLLVILATLSLALGSSFAGCGKIDTTKGKLKAVNKEAKSITVVDASGAEVKLTLTPTSKADDIDGLVGKEVTVTSSHKKIETVKAS